MSIALFQFISLGKKKQEKSKNKVLHHLTIKNGDFTYVQHVSLPYLTNYIIYKKRSVEKDEDECV